ncbi:hypothetical protein FRB97_001055 [Tulasnella sp. 331]|nr:hypothetical protein FRB97_001055 [Tulasnella sp. 331]KAG8886750.1 hypothetical protein FRB98_001051 [Tulasnella sp. 332]
MSSSTASSSSSQPRLPSTHPRRRASTSTSTARRSSSSKTFALFTCLALTATVAHSAPIRPIPEALQAIQSYQATVGRSVSSSSSAATPYLTIPEPVSSQQVQTDDAPEESEFEEDGMSTSMMGEVEEQLRREMAMDPFAGAPKPDSITGSSEERTNVNVNMKPLMRSRRRRRAHP